MTDISKLIPASSGTKIYQFEFVTDTSRVNGDTVYIVGTRDAAYACYRTACATLLEDLRYDVDAATQEIMNHLTLPVIEAEELARNIITLETRSDVRCAITSEDISKTTSQSDVGARQIAAQATYRSVALVSADKRAIVKAGFLRITYADGGTEQWPVVNPAFSDGGINQPMPGTLVVRDGIPKPKACGLT